MKEIIGSIHSLYINHNEGSLGLFGIISEGIVKNVRVIGSIEVPNSNACAGGIVGSVEVKQGAKETKLINLQNEVIIRANHVIGVGGIVGLAYNSKIENCSNKAKIVGGNCVGGIVGDIKESATEVKQCCNLGEICADSVGNFFGFECSNVRWNCRIPRK